MKKIFLFFLTILLSSTFSFGQTPAKWSVNGNATSSGDFFGTTNNNPVIFYANNTEWMRLKTNGDLKINSLSGTGDNFVFSNSNGVLFTKPCSSDTNKFMTEAGVFRTASSFTGWKFNGNNIHTITGSFVGIGTNNPQYQLDVAGDARLYGTLYAQGLILATKLQADTVKSTSMISINNNLSFFSGSVNDIFTTSGDLRFQSRVGYTGNTILNAGNNGNVGIGIYTPQYKFDVNGDARLNGKTYVYRLDAVNGDSIIRFGDSTMNFNYNLGEIYNTNTSGWKGLGIGNGALANASHSTAIGFRVWCGASANEAITLGSGVSNGPIFINNIPFSLSVGFNSTVPTFFVGPASGVGTFGKVGVGTTNPQSTFQVGDGFASISVGSAPGVASTFSTSYIGFNVARTGVGQWITQNDNANNGGTVLLSDVSGGLRIIGLPSIGATNQALSDQFIQDHTKFYLRGDGRVEIGTTKIIPGSQYDDASTRMTVDGRIMCQDLVVSKSGSGDWPDFVFDSSYVLLPLDTMADYLSKNKHLPLSQSASYIDINGISIAETIEVQQQQTEEMMLYILQLNERLKALEVENAELKAKGGK